MDVKFRFFGDVVISEPIEAELDRLALRQIVKAPAAAAKTRSLTEF